MNPDSLEDCAEGRDIFFFFVAAGWCQQGNYVSRVCGKERLERPPKTKSWEILGKLFEKLGMYSHNATLARSPFTVQGGGRLNWVVR